MNCQVMGIVNVTPDSFSDGGQYYRPEEALRRVRNLVEEGADVIDLGGESTRPEATPLGWETEWARLEPVLKLLAAEPGAIALSVDTYHVETARRAVEAGVGIVNCVKFESAAAMLELLRARPDLRLVMPCRLAADGGLAAEARRAVDEFGPRLYLDPLIGFGTTREEDLRLLASLPKLAEFGRVLVGVSRKRLVKKLTGEKRLGKNLGGSLGLAVWAALNGASAVRVHDVLETAQALRAVAALA